MKVATIQLVSSPDVQENSARIRHWLAAARAAGAELAALPEGCLTLGRKTAFDEDEQERVIAQVQDWAREFQLWLVAGTLPLKGALRAGVFHYDAAQAKPWSSTLVLDNLGQIVSSYSKIHLFDADVNDNTQTYRESERFSHGSEVVSVESPWGTLGFAVCYDLRFPELFAELIRRGSQVIFVPSAFTAKTGRAHWEVLLRARAIEGQCFIVAPNQGGEHLSGQVTWGESMVVNPWGEIRSKLGSGEGMLITDLALDEVPAVRKNMPLSQHRRLR